MLKAFLPEQPSPHRPTAQSFKVTAGPRPLDELLTLASAAARAGTSVSFTDVKARPIEDLVRIAAVGGDCVSFGPDGTGGPEQDIEEAPPRGAIRRLFSRFAPG